MQSLERTFEESPVSYNKRTRLGNRIYNPDAPYFFHKKNKRGRCTLDSHRPRRYIILGIADTGKSALNQLIALHHPKILDIYGSRDNENLCWCRKNSPVDDILLIHGDNTEVNSSWDTVKASKITMKDIDGYEAVVTCSGFFSEAKVKFTSIQKIADSLYQRSQWKQGDIIYLLFRETMNVLYSRTSQGLGEKEAKADILYFVREMRHFGVSIGADTLRWTGIDKELRDIADYTLFKNVGEKGLPKEKRFLYRFYKPYIFRRMRSNQFITLKANGDIAFCKFPLVPFHKQEGVDLMKELGITVEHGDKIDEGTVTRIGDKEHERIVSLYYELKSMGKVAKIVHRSSATVSKHVKDHNNEVIEKQKCSRCHRLGSDLADVQIEISIY